MDQVVRIEPQEEVVSVSEDLAMIRNSTLVDLINRLGFERLVASLPKISNAADLPSGSEDLATIKNLRKEVSETMRAFDNWTLFGDQIDDEDPLDVGACASRLEELVLSIREVCVRPQWDVTNEAIATLLQLASGTLSRNRDANQIASVAWGFDDSAASHVELDGNLYTRLMRHNPANDGASIFAALNEIGHDVLFVYETEIKTLIQNVLTLGLAQTHRDEVDRLSDRLSRGRKRGAESSQRGTSSRGRARR